MRPELHDKRQKLKQAADDLIKDYMAEHDDLREQILNMENALAMKKAQLAMVDDQITQLSRSSEALARE